MATPNGPDAESYKEAFRLASLQRVEKHLTRITNEIADLRSGDLGNGKSTEAMRFAVYLGSRIRDMVHSALMSPEEIDAAALGHTIKVGSVPGAFRLILNLAAPTSPIGQAASAGLKEWDAISGGIVSGSTYLVEKVPYERLLDFAHLAEGGINPPRGFALTAAHVNEILKAHAKHALRGDGVPFDPLDPWQFPDSPPAETDAEPTPPVDHAPKVEIHVKDAAGDAFRRVAGALDEHRKQTEAIDAFVKRRDAYIAAGGRPLDITDLYSQEPLKKIDGSNLDQETVQRIHEAFSGLRTAVDAAEGHASSAAGAEFPLSGERLRGVFAGRAE